MSTRGLVSWLVLGAALGWYLALFTTALVMGNAEFNESFPNPWRVLLAAPSVFALIAWWSMPGSTAGASTEGKRW